MSCAAEYVAKQAEKEEQRAAALAAKAAAKEPRRRQITQVGSWWQAHRLITCAVAADMVVYRVHRALQHANMLTQHRIQRWLCGPSILSQTGEASNS